MNAILLALFLPALAGNDDPPVEDLPALIARIESLLAPVEDFRCEYEGTMRFMGKVAERERDRVGADGLAESFGGVFLWTQAGDVRGESLHRYFPDPMYERKSLAIREQGKQVRYMRRDVPAVPVVGVTLQTQSDVDNGADGVLGQFVFFVPLLKRLAADQRRTVTVSDGELDGRPMKVVAIGLAGVPGLVTSRLWIDLQRNGHIVKCESYGDGKIDGRREFTLERFEVGDAEVWMPVSMDAWTYAAVENGRPVATKDPTVHIHIEVRRDSLRFNTHPDPETFTLGSMPESVILEIPREGDGQP
jgi:hypothetical protein